MSRPLSLKERIAISENIEIKTKSWPVRLWELKEGKLTENDISFEELVTFHKFLNSIGIPRRLAENDNDSEFEYV